MSGGKPLVLPIIREVAAQAGYSVEELISHDQHQRITSVRHFAMWRAKKETGRSWPEVARFFNRDHTTVMNGFRRVEMIPEEERGVFTDTPRKKPHFAGPEYGLKYQGKPCRKGHNGMKYVSSGRCVQCKLDRDRRRDRARYYAEAAE